MIEYEIDRAILTTPNENLSKEIEPSVARYCTLEFLVDRVKYADEQMEFCRQNNDEDGEMYWYHESHDRDSCLEWALEARGCKCIHEVAEYIRRGRVEEFLQQAKLWGVLFLESLKMALPSIYEEDADQALDVAKKILSGELPESRIDRGEWPSDTPITELLSYGDISSLTFIIHLPEDNNTHSLEICGVTKRGLYIKNYIFLFVESPSTHVPFQKVVSKYNLQEYRLKKESLETFLLEPVKVFENILEYAVLEKATGDERENKHLFYDLMEHKTDVVGTCKECGSKGCGLYNDLCSSCFEKNKDCKVSCRAAYVDVCCPFCNEVTSFCIPEPEFFKCECGKWVRN